MNTPMWRRLVGGTLVAVPALLIATVLTWFAASWADRQTPDQGLAAWVQAIGSVAAILLAAITLWIQRAQGHSDQQAEAVRLMTSIDALSREAFEQVTERLRLAVDPEPGSGPAPREYRTTEMIEALREISVAQLPPELLEPFVVLRSTLYAVNCQIGDACHGPVRGLRTVALASAIRIHRDAEQAASDLNYRCVRAGIEEWRPIIPYQVEQAREEQAKRD